jgi:hypothetical protein
LRKDGEGYGAVGSGADAWRDVSGPYIGAALQKV